MCFIGTLKKPDRPPRNYTPSFCSTQKPFCFPSVDSCLWALVNMHTFTSGLQLKYFHYDEVLCKQYSGDRIIINVISIIEPNIYMLREAQFV